MVLLIPYLLFISDCQVQGNLIGITLSDLKDRFVALLKRKTLSFVNSKPHHDQSRTTSSALNDPAPSMGL